MGSCVSSTRQRRRSRKLSVAARKFRRKVSAAIADAPIIRGAGDAAGCFARHGVVHVEAPDSNVTLHLTKLQWQHSQMDAGSVICEEAWYDSVSILESTDSDDDLDNDFASVSGGNGVIRIHESGLRSHSAVFRYFLLQFRSSP